MQFIQATQRTIEALKKADALNSTSKMRTTSSSSMTSPSMLQKHDGEVMQKPVQVSAALLGNFFPLYEHTDTEDTLTIGRIDLNGWHDDGAGRCYWLGETYLNWLQIPSKKFVLDPVTTNPITVLFAMRRNVTTTGPAGDDGSYFKVAYGSNIGYASDGTVYINICSLYRKSRGNPWTLVLNRFPGDLVIENMWMNS